MEFRNKKIIVTGASDGIGYELAELLGEKGAYVLAESRSINGSHFTSGRINTVESDIRNSENVDKLIDYAIKSMGTIDIFIANAGIGYYGKTAADWSHMEDIFNLNVFSPIYALTKLCSIFPNKVFQFVIINSGAGRIPLPGYSLYCSTKFALDGFARTFRFELPENVKLSVVYPVSVETDFFDKAALGAPAPKPVKPLKTTAKKIVKGIEDERDEIYPSKVFPVMTNVNKFLPIVEATYQSFEKKRFGNWLRTHNQTPR